MKEKEDIFEKSIGRLIAFFFATVALSKYR